MEVMSFTLLILVLSSFDRAETAPILQEDSKFNQLDNNNNKYNVRDIPGTPTKPQENYITATKLNGEGEGTWLLVLGSLLG